MDETEGDAPAFFAFLTTCLSCTALEGLHHSYSKWILKEYKKLGYTS